MTTHIINKHGGVDDIFDEFGDIDNPGVKPEVGDRCLRCAKPFQPGQHVITFDTWAVDPKQGLSGVHFHAVCAEQMVAALLQDVASLADKEPVGMYTAYRHTQLSRALAAVIVAGVPKMLVNNTKRRLTE